MKYTSELIFDDFRLFKLNVTLGSIPSTELNPLTIAKLVAQLVLRQFKAQGEYNQWISTANAAQHILAQNIQTIININIIIITNVINCYKEQPRLQIPSKIYIDYFQISVNQIKMDVYGILSVQYILRITFYTTHPQMLSQIPAFTQYLTTINQYKQQQIKLPQMVQRVTYRRRLSYNTASNKIRKVRTPGSKVVVHYVGKKPRGVHAPHDSCDCGKRINGIPKLSSHAYHSLSRRQKTVSRAYGGVLCAGCVRERIVRAFLIEEMKVVKRVVANQKKTKKDKTAKK